MATPTHVFSPIVEGAFAKKPGLKERLDEAALQALGRADPSQAAQVLEDLIVKTDVRNPSAFVASALGKNLAPRMMPPLSAVAGGVSSREDLLLAFPTVAARLDDRARRRVRDSDPMRAKEILTEILNREDLQNPSAFVMKSLTYTRDRHEGPPGMGMQERDYLAATQVETLLSGYPTLRAKLDGQAVRKMRDYDLTRVQEVLQELDSRGDAIINPSAFAMKALSDPAQLRQPEAAPEAALSSQALLAAQYMLAAQAAQAQLLAIPGLTSQLTNPLAAAQLGLTAPQLPAQLTAPQLAAAQLTAPQLAAPQLAAAAPQLTAPQLTPPANPLQSMLGLQPTLSARPEDAAMSKAAPARPVEVPVPNPSAMTDLSRGRPEFRSTPGDPMQAFTRSRSPHRGQAYW